jgi:hypothetical protein
VPAIQRSLYTKAQVIMNVISRITEKVNVTPVKPKKSPLDVESVDLSLSAADIVSVVNEGCERNCGF